MRLLLQWLACAALVWPSIVWSTLAHVSYQGGGFAALLDHRETNIISTRWSQAFARTTLTVELWVRAPALPAPLTTRVPLGRA